VLEWEPGPDLVGDFTWPGFGDDVVVADHVLTALRERFSGFEPGSVEMVQDPKLKRTTRGHRRVWLPYEGPALHELWVTAWAHVDRERSSIELERRCGTCDREFWELYGVEQWEADYYENEEDFVRGRTERLPRAGLFVPKDDLAGADIFRIYKFPGWIFCTESVRRFVEEEGFSNVAFLEMGDIVI